MSRLLQPLRSLLFGPTDAERTISQLQQKLDRTTARLKESYDYADTLLDPLERYRDGTDLYLPANGRLYDRKRGDQWPFLRTMYDLQNARGQSRAVTEGNGYGAGFLDRATDFVIGDGHQLSVKLKGNKTGATNTGVADADGDGRPDVDPVVEKIEAFLKEFKELNDWGMGEEDREEEGFRRSQQDSEVLVRFFAGGAKTNGVPTVRWIDPEYLDEPPGAQDHERWGIRTDPDDIETREAFYVKGQDGVSGEWIDAEKIVYHKLGTGRTVKRGFPLFYIVCEALWQCEKINRNLAEVSAIQAAIAYVRQHGAETLPSQIDDLISNNADYQTKPRGGYRTGADRTVQVQWQDPGQVVDMSAGMEFAAGPASSGVANFVSALQSRLRQVCARFGYPEFFTSDASNNNYASILVSGGPFERNIKRRQRRYASFQEAVFKRALMYGVKAGRLTQEDVDAVQVCVEPPGVSIANQLEETQIRQIENQAGVLSVQTWMVKAGYDPKLETANKEAWDAKFAPQMGEPGQGGDEKAGGKPGYPTDPKAQREGFDPSQPRDDHGRWGSGGTGSNTEDDDEDDEPEHVTAARELLGGDPADEYDGPDHSADHLGGPGDDNTQDADERAKGLSAELAGHTAEHAAFADKLVGHLTAVGVPEDQAAEVRATYQTHAPTVAAAAQKWQAADDASHRAYRLADDLESEIDTEKGYELVVPDVGPAPNQPDKPRTQKELADYEQAVTDYRAAVEAYKAKRAESREKAKAERKAKIGEMRAKQKAAFRSAGESAKEAAAAKGEYVKRADRLVRRVGEAAGEVYRRHSQERESFDPSQPRDDHGRWGSGGSGKKSDMDSSKKDNVPTWNGSPITHHGSPTGGFNGHGRGHEEFVRFGNNPEGGKSTNNIEDTPEEGVSGFDLKEDDDGLYFISGDTDMEPLLERPAYVVKAVGVGTGADGEPLFDADSAKATHRMTNIRRDGYKWRFDLEKV